MFLSHGGRGWGGGRGGEGRNGLREGCLEVSMA